MKEEKLQRIYKAIMLIVLTASITFIITSVVMYNSIGDIQPKVIKVESTNNNNGITKTFQTLRNFIEKNYIGEIDDNNLLEAAIKGYIKGLNDEYSEYITKDEMKEYMESTVGNYVGIGVYIANDTKNNQIVVLLPMKGSPAEEAGIQSGDVITKVDGIEYTGEELDKASAALKSKEGTTAKVEILRGEEILTLDVERRHIKINHMDSEVLENSIGYIQINTFDEGCYKEFEENWNKLKDQNIKGLIIDLRNNGGGIVEEAMAIADMFTNKDDILLITTEKGKEQETIQKSQIDKQIDMPVVILINEATASASEILTADLRENNSNIKVVGNKSYGKGVIQTIFSFTDGSGLKLTTNEYFTPKHNKINKVGITPDEEVELPEGKNMYTVKKEEDTQLQKAIELLK